MINFWKIHCNNLSILDRERRKRPDKRQANAEVSFGTIKRAPIGYYYQRTVSSKVLVIHFLAGVAGKNNSHHENCCYSTASVQ